MRMDIVEKIWEQGCDEGKFGYLDRFNGDSFRETDYFDEKLARPGVDLYFSAGTFLGEEKRMNETLMNFNVLWADLDRGYDEEKLDELAPTILWATSPENFQAVWFVDDLRTYEEWARYNKALTYFLRADKGGWHGSKLLRIPGTPNWKHWDSMVGMAPLGHVVYNTTRIVSRHRLDKKLEPHFPSPSLVGLEGMPERLNQKDWYEMMAAIWKNLPISIQAMVTETPTDRSAHIWDMAVQGSKMAVNKFTMFQIIWGCPFNKYRDRPTVLWSTVEKAYER